MAGTQAPPAPPAPAAPAPAPATPSPAPDSGGGGEGLGGIIQTVTDWWVLIAVVVAYIGANILWSKYRKAAAQKGQAVQPLGSILSRYIKHTLIEDRHPVLTKPANIASKLKPLTWQRVNLLLLALVILHALTGTGPGTPALLTLLLLSTIRANKTFKIRRSIVQQMFDVAAGECRYPKGAELAPWRYIQVQKWEDRQRPGTTSVSYPAKYDSENPQTREKFERQFNGTVSDEHSWTYTWESSKNRVICSPTPFLPTKASYPTHDKHPWNEFPLGLAGEGKEAIWDVAVYPHCLIAGPTGSGKALDTATPISTPSGWTTMGDLTEGDLVFGEHGRPVRITKAHTVLHGRPCYEVVFSDGSTIIADADHLWTTQSQAQRRTGAPGSTLTTLAILATLKRGGENNHSIPVAGPLDYPEAQLPIDPYYLGYWLGDGRSYGAGIVTEDVPVLDRVRSVGYSTTYHGNAGNAEAHNVSDGTHGGLVKLLRAYDLLKTAEFPRATNDGGGRVPCGPADGPFLSTAQAAAVLGVGRQTVQNYAASGLLPSMLAGKNRRYPEAAVHALRKAQAVKDAAGAEPGLVTVPEAAEALKISRNRLMAAMRASDVTAAATRRTGGGPAQLYRLSDIDAALSAHDRAQETKHIPDDYLRADTDQRRALLAGLMDSDGTVKGNGRSEFANTNERLARQTLELVLSLGYQATLRSDIPTCNGKAGKRCWYVGFTATQDNSPFGLLRKTAHLPRTQKMSLNRYITDVRAIPSRPVRCIEVDNPSKLFLAGRNMIPTHNSVTQRVILLHALQSPDWRIVGIDPKRVEMSWLKGLDNVLKIASNLEDGVEICEDVEAEMRSRYDQMETAGVNHFRDLNPRPPALLLMVDETFAFLSPEGIKSDEGKARDEAHARASTLLGSIARLGRASGIHMILATQRPDAKVLSGEMKNNLDARIATGRMDTTPSLMVLDSEAATRIPAVKGRGILRLASDTIDFQTYFTPLEDLPAILAAAKARNEALAAGLPDPTVVESGPAAGPGAVASALVKLPGVGPVASKAGGFLAKRAEVAAANEQVSAAHGEAVAQRKQAKPSRKDRKAAGVSTDVDVPEAALSLSKDVPEPEPVETEPRVASLVKEELPVRAPEPVPVPYDGPEADETTPDQDDDGDDGDDGDGYVNPWDDLPAAEPVAPAPPKTLPRPPAAAPPAALPSRPAPPAGLPARPVAPGGLPARPAAPGGLPGRPPSAPGGLPGRPSPPA